MLRPYINYASRRLRLAARASATVAVVPAAATTATAAVGGRRAHAAVSTSGDTEQFVEIGGKRYSHIVDPKTGMGLVGRMSATVVAKDGTASDSLAKVAVDSAARVDSARVDSVAVRE